MSTTFMLLKIDWSQIALPEILTGNFPDLEEMFTPNCFNTYNSIKISFR